MADEPGPPARFWPEWLTPRRWWEFGAAVLDLQRSVAQLKQENARLRADVARLELAVERQGGQIEVLTRFVDSSLKR